MKLHVSVHFKHCSESATSQEGAGIYTELPKNVKSKGTRQASRTLWPEQRRYPPQKSQELDKMSKGNSTTSITGLNLLLYVACITIRVLLADKIRFLLGDMCKVNENNHDTCDGSAPIGGGISSKWNNSSICTVSHQMVKVLSSLNRESLQKLLFCGMWCHAVLYTTAHVLTVRKYTPHGSTCQKTVTFKITKLKHYY